MSDNRYSIPAAYKRTTLAAAIALTFATPAAFAATANQLPGNGAVSGSKGAAKITSSPSKNSSGVNNETITVGGRGTGPNNLSGAGHVTIKWGSGGSGTSFNTNQPAGFNIGSKAALHFQNKATGTQSAVLNIDNSGNASQIMGTLNNNSPGTHKGVDIFVANGNGIIVGSGATIKSNGAVGLIGESSSNLKNGSFSAATGNYDGITFNGTSGGKVSVAKNASISAGSSSTLLIAGGSNVNVALGALQQGNARLMAGENNVTASGTFAATNSKAALTTTGKISGATIKTFESGGNAVNQGTADLHNASGSLTVGGTFTNNGDLTLPRTTTSTPKLNINNVGKLTTESGQSGEGKFASLTNKGTYNSNGAILVKGGNLTNSGSINAVKSSASSAITVTNGSVTNSGTMKNVLSLSTTSTSTAKSGADFSITNSGTISGLTSATGIQADFGSNNKGTKTTGSFTNTGVLSVQSTSGLTAKANNNLDLGGQLQVAGTNVSSSNPITGAIHLASTKGMVKLSTPLYFNGTSDATLKGQQVAVMSNLMDTSSSQGTVTINAGADLNSKGKYAVRVAKGKTVSAKTVKVHGQSSGNSSYDNPNVILQGTLSGNTIKLGKVDNSGNDNGAVSDVFSGPKGGLTATGSSPTVTINFTGRVKTAPYTNDSSNFRYNDLPITSKNQVNLNLNPVAYQTNGTTNVSSSGSKSAVNILVNNGVTVKDNVNGNATSGGSTPSSVPSAGSSSVTGLNNWPNTHLVLQSTGNITAAKNNSGDFYWPGLVYMGTIKTMNGNPAPGTLSQYGTISATGNFNNVLPGSTAKGGGIHFETAQTLSVSGNVVTNAKSWINFANSSLTNHYANTNSSYKVFYGGSQGSGSVVNYNLLPKNDFNTQAVVSKK